MPAEPVRSRLTVTDDGPVLVYGPIEVVLPDGRRVRSDRAVTALCTCHRSRSYPICDASHRRRVRKGTVREIDPAKRVRQTDAE